MPLPVLDDIDSYLEEFGVDAVYTDSSGVAKKIKVIFDRADATLSPGSIDIQSFAPSVQCKSSDVGDIGNACTFLIDGTTYYVSNSNIDATGMTKASLSTQATT